MHKTLHLPFILLNCLCLLNNPFVHAQQTMETGGHKMPDEWIDQDTHYKVIRLSRIEGSNASFYFHNNPFIAIKWFFIIPIMVISRFILLI